MKVNIKIKTSAFLGGLVLAQHISTAFAQEKSRSLVKNNHVYSLEQSMKKGVSILHVISPFEVQDCLPQFCPFDQAQSVVIGSMLHAKENTSQGQVTLTMAAFKEDLKSISVEGFDALPALTRSTATEYPELPSNQRLPFIQDILDRALKHDTDAEYIIYTNSDIILHESFYDTIQDIIAEEGYDFFTINRRLISKTRDNGELRTIADLDEIFVSDYTDHPGTDCFIMKREVAEKLNLESVFLGTLFFANAMNLQAHYYSEKSASYKSEQVVATFHLGDDRKWMDESKRAYVHQNAINAVCQNQWLQDVCSAEDLAEKRPNVWTDCKRLKRKMEKWLVDKFEFNDGKNICHSPLEDEPVATSKARFIFSLGTEGTGHHFLSKLEKTSADANPANEEQWFGKLREEQRQAAKLLREIYRLDDLPTSPNTVDLVPVYEELVKKLKSMQEIVQMNIENDVLSIHLNTFNNFMTSFPATNTTARYTQLPDLGILYKACQDAEVECGHILMTRDAHEILRSTTKNRYFDESKRQIISISMQLNMMISQAVQYSDKLVGCFDFNDPTSLVDYWIGENMFGWNIHDDSLEDAITANYSPSRRLKEEERVKLVPDGFDLYMDAMIRATNVLRTTCRKQLLDLQSETPAVSIDHPVKEEVSHLLPPFKVVQIGAPRTGSTFQFELLRAIVALKSPEGPEITTRAISKSDWNEGVFEELMDSTENFVVKTHIADERLHIAGDSGAISVFSSSDIVPHSLYTQHREKLEECSACEIDQYRSLFGLTDDEVATLKQHMHDYEILRQCCGFQMSKYEVLRLNGCDVSEYIDQPDYPHCERHDLSSVEMSFAGSAIPFETNSPEFNWAAPGDCARLNAEVASGKGFNGRSLDGCTLNGKFAGVKGSEGTLRTTSIASEEQDFRVEKLGLHQVEMSPMMEDYIQFHRSATSGGILQEGVKYIVYQCNDSERCGGVGDRVLGMIKALYLAIATNRVLLIDSIFPLPLEDYLEPNKILWNAGYPATSMRLDDFDESVPFSMHSDTSGYILGRTNGLGRHRLSNVISSPLMKEHMERHGFENNLSFAEYVHQGFWCLFRFSELVLSRSNEMKGVAGLSEESYVGLHYRSGDRAIPGVNGVTSFQRAVPITDIQKCANLVKASYPEKIKLAYLASDNKKAKQEMSSSDLNIRIADDVEIFHIDKSLRSETTIGENQLTESEVQRGTLDNWAELAVLAESDCLVMANSMYSFIAYYIRGKNTCNVHISDCDAQSVLNYSRTYEYEPGDWVDEKRIFQRRNIMEEEQTNTINDDT